MGLLRGEFRGRREGSAWTPWRPNLVVYRCLDLIGALLTGGPSLDGITFLAVGAGEDDWDANPPPPDRGRTRLAAETFRKRLEPGRDLTVDPATGVVRVSVTLGRGEATGVLRELGLFGGDASARPGSGFLVNHRVHERIDKADDDVLQRELRLTLTPELLPGARSLIGGLLARRPGLAGLQQVALGTSDEQPTDPPRELVEEAYRKPVDLRRLRYDPSAHTVTASAAFEPGEGPTEVREAGLFGGEADGRPGSGFLVVRLTGPARDRTGPDRLEQRFQLMLVSRTDVTVPDLVGRTLERAQTALTEADLLPGTVTERETDADPPGTVLEQAPAAGAVVHEATPVVLVVATVPLISVPPLVGLPEQQGVALLEELGLVNDVTGRTETESEEPPGTILRVSPSPGTRVPGGTRVVLNVAILPRALVPDVRGNTAAAAALLLEVARLRLASPPFATRESSATPGTIVAQQPDPGSRVPRGRRVAVTFATPWTVVVPDLTGLTPEAATASLADAAAVLVATLGLAPGLAGLALGAITERTADAPLGTIVEQVPGAGERALLYGTVDVVVAAAGVRKVPDLAGLDRASAATTLTGAGYALGPVTTRASSAAEGTVVAQDPPGGRDWPVGARVAITVTARLTVRVPDVRGLQVEAARETVTGRGLVMAPPQPQAADGVPGTVLQQEPLPGTVVPSGAEVHLVVRAGVPDVVGMTLAEATATIEGVGLVMATALEEESQTSVGLVLRQEPPAGSPAQPGTAVQVTIGVEPGVVVPEVVGLAFGEAQELLHPLRLPLRVRGSRGSDLPAGTILEQEPAAGQRVPRGTEVGVIVAARAEIVLVPDVVGLLVEEARARLTEVGLETDVAGSRPAPGGTPGTVLEQAPEAGSQVQRGTTVALILASADDTVEVPDVRRQPFERAVQLLERVSLGCEVIGRRRSDDPPGTVLDQRPPPGARAPGGSVVGVILAAGRDMRVPQVVGGSALDATEVLHELGLEVIVEEQFSLNVAPGTVLAQEPPAGTLVRLGSEVQILVAVRRLPRFVAPSRPS